MTNGIYVLRNKHLPAFTLAVNHLVHGFEINVLFRKPTQ